MPFRLKSINLKHERESEKKQKVEEKKVVSKYWIAFQAGRTDVKSLTSVIQSFFPTAEKNVDSLETPSDFLGTFSERQKLLAPLYWKKKRKDWDRLGPFGSRLRRYSQMRAKSVQFSRLQWKAPGPGLVRHLSYFASQKKR